jgi:carboxyl-terminal processing protease
MLPQPFTLSRFEFRKSWTISAISLLINAGSGECLWAQTTAPGQAPASTNDARAAEPEFDGRAEFLKVWELVNAQFYRADFNGVDWAAARETYLPRAVQSGSHEELAAVINEMLGLLRTSHTNYYTTSDPEYYFLFGIFSSGPLGEEAKRRFPEGQVQFDSLGLMTRRVDGKWFVSGVLDGSPAALAGIHRGNELLSLNGQPFAPVRPLQGLAAKGAEVELELQPTPEMSSRRKVSLRPYTLQTVPGMLTAMEQSMRMIEHRGQRIAYVHVWSYAGEQYHERLLAELTEGSFKDADALVLDIRDGWGGASPEYLNLFNRNIPQLRAITRDKQELYFETQWRKPVALLINGGSRSGKELLAYGFRKHGIGPVVGERTAGAVTAGTVIPIGDESLLYLAVMGMEVDGEILEGVGVAPDQEVPWPLPYASAEDPQLQRALDLLTDPAQAK